MDRSKKSLFFFQFRRLSSASSRVAIQRFAPPDFATPIPPIAPSSQLWSSQKSPKMACCEERVQRRRRRRPSRRCHAFLKIQQSMRQGEKNIVSANAASASEREPEKKKNPRRQSLLARHKVPTTYRKTVLENAMVTMSGERNLQSGRKRSKRGGEEVVRVSCLSFSPPPQSSKTSEQAKRAPPASDCKSRAGPHPRGLSYRSRLPPPLWIT